MVNRGGLTPYQALLTGTRNIAQYLGILDSSGTVAVGKRADLVLLHGNPLEDITHTREPAGVMLAGRWLDAAELSARLVASPKEWKEFVVRYQLSRAQRKLLGRRLRTFEQLADARLGTGSDWRRELKGPLDPSRHRELAATLSRRPRARSL